MNFTTYVQLSKATEKPIIDSNLKIIHYLLGMGGEYFSEVFTPDVMDNKEKLVKEYGDFMWYFAGYLRCKELSITPITTPGKYNLSTSQALGSIFELEKKRMYYDKVIDTNQLQNLLNTVYYNVEATLQEVGLSLEECLQINIDKLKLRYPEGFSNEAAINKADEQSTTV